MTPKFLDRQPKIVFFDIDDTLYIKQHNCVPDSVKTALLVLKQNGIIPAIATGRGVCVFPPCINQLICDVGIELLVTINGQYNMFQGSKLIDFPLPTHHIKATTEYLIGQNLAYAYMTYDEILGFHETPAMIDALNSLHIPYRVLDKFVFDRPVYQMLAFYADDDKVVLKLDQALKSVRWHTNGVDILTKESSKVRGIKVVLDKLGLGFDDALAFGDGLNDLEMLTAVGFGVAMGNAHEKLKLVADYVCPRHDQDGIYYGLKALGLI